MTEERSGWIHDEIELLQTARDELRVQLHLAGAEARDRWEELERSWHHLESHGKRVSEAASEATSGIEDAARLLIDEIKSGYERIRDAL